MIAFRRAHSILSREHFYTDDEIQWFGARGGSPDWSDPSEKRFACMVHEGGQNELCLIFNAGSDAVDFNLLAPPPGLAWRLAVDSSREAPHDLFEAGEEPLCEDQSAYRV